ncbi:MAG: response regulator [Actinobacteria bacterium]|nr:response regulator [Actinomycetota bacterium]
MVVIADDNDDIRDLLAARLSTRGYHIIPTADGQAALDAIHEHKPDIAVLDWVMPVIQGHELCVKLKTDPTTCRIPVVILTARGEEEDRLLGLDLGADAYVVKPFDIDEVDTILRRLLDGGDSPSDDSLSQILY